MNKAGKKKLNKEQLQAIKHKSGPLLIIAGAGTGKTTVVTERIKYLIEKDLAKPPEVLALTFTEKAALEMEERVDVALPYGYTSMWISTFHSFCDRILRAEALHIGLNPRFKLMTEAETVQFIRANLFKFKLDYFRPLGNPTKFISGMIQHFSRLQDEDVSPNQYLDWAKNQSSKIKVQNDEEKIETKKWKELAGAYRTYDELKTKEGFFDFGDLITKTLKLFRDRPNILKNYQKQFKHILVDEFQDTNYAQNELAILLAGKGEKANIAVTGDDDQSIYRFRGAAVSNIIQFRKTYPKAKIVVLTKNYRSGQDILDKAYGLIQHNNPDRLESVENIEKKLISQRKDIPAEIKFIHSDRVENEAEQVVKEIKKLVNQVDQVNQGKTNQLINQSTNQLEYRDIAILVRANNHSEPFIRALQRHSIPYQFLGPGRLFRQAEVVDLISYLKVLYDFDDSVALYRVLSNDHFDIPARDLIRIGSYAKRYNLSLYEACVKVEEAFVSQETKEKVKSLVKIIEKHLKLVRKETAGQLLYYFLEDTGLLQKLLTPDSVDAEKKARNVSKFFDKLKTYEVDHEDASVTAICDWIELSSELGESPLAADTDWTEINAVNILTVHSAKGLEFPVVFLVNLVGQRFPTIERREQIPIPDALIKELLPQGDFHLQEERRLFYVGITRAMNSLYLTAADYYGEGKREKKLSPFIFEALGDEAVASEPSVAKAMEGRQLSFLDYQPDKDQKDKAVVRRLKAIDEQKIHIDFLSYSQIETFRICPLHYKLKYILRLPTPPSAAQSFGISMHAALKEFYEGVIAGEKPSEKMILKKLDQVWVREGYASKSHEKKSLTAARSYLKKFYKNQFDYQNLPLALEKPFVVPLRSLARRGVTQSRKLKVGGKIDRVDRLSGGKIEVIDYKTGSNIPDQKWVDKDLQLTLYALAATSINESPFNKKPEEVKLSLYYFDGEKKISTVRTKEQLAQAEKEVRQWRKKIEESDFRCSGHMFCKNCEYSLMCRVDGD